VFVQVRCHNHGILRSSRALGVVYSDCSAGCAQARRSERVGVKYLLMGRCMAASKQQAVSQKVTAHLFLGHIWRGSLTYMSSNYKTANPQECNSWRGIQNPGRVWGL